MNNSNGITWGACLDRFCPPERIKSRSIFFPLLSRPSIARSTRSTSVCWFISEYADELARDGLLDECRSEAEGCLRYWVADFTVEHFDRDGGAAKGWGLSYFDCVHRSETVCETLCDLDRFARHADLADRFITSLASSDEPVASGWFLELARGQDDIYHPPPRKSFQSCFTDPALLAHKQAIVQEHLAPAATSPTYWNDSFAKLRLEAQVDNKRA